MLFRSPNLLLLDLSSNPLGEGASVRNLNLSCVPRLKYLDLDDVKMTKEQANDLTTAVRQSKISNLLSLYHVSAVCFTLSLIYSINPQLSFAIFSFLSCFVKQKLRFAFDFWRINLLQIVKKSLKSVFA